MGPVIKYKFGSKPRIGGKKANKEAVEREESQWIYKTLQPTDWEQKLLIGTAL